MGIDDITLFRTMKIHIKLLHSIIDHLNLVITQHPDFFFSTNQTQKKKYMYIYISIPNMLHKHK